jgi:aminoglycoside phosphotransferase (APT) family kinase protein
VTDAAAAAVAAGRDIGLRVDDPVVLSDGTNVLVHLRPSPVVARVSVTLLRGTEALENELAFALAAAERGARVAAPADDRVHERDGFPITFWRYVEHRRAEPADAAAVGAALRTLHDAVADLDLQLPRFDRLDEVESVARALDHPDSALMLRAIAAARERLGRLELVERPLHGDAHMRNVLVTQTGPQWSDLENVCSGPVEYDLACLAWRTKVHGWHDCGPALAAYGDHDPQLVEELMPVLAAFLVPWNTRVALRLGGSFDPIVQERIDYLRTFT